jgi:type VI secretion system protein VasG
VFDRGFMRDGEGRVIDFRHTVILMTSNLGSEQIMVAADAAREAAIELTMPMLTDSVRPLLLEHFQPALLARFQTIVYRPLSADALATIVRMKLDKVARRVAQRFAVSMVCDDALVAELVRACQLPDSGARNIDSLLDQQILPVLARELLVRSHHHSSLSGIRLGYSDEDGVTVEFESALEQAA